MKRAFALSLGLVLSLAVAAQQNFTAAGKVVNSRHDLSVNSVGSTYKASTQNQVCIFCHTPHNANPKPGLWNHQLSTGITYGTYSSSTLVSTMGQPGAADNTKLCLGCHDGTVALGNTVNDGSIAMQNSVTVLPANAGQTYSPARSTNLGTTLADDHPVAFTPVSSVLPAYPQIQPPPAGDPVQLESGMLQCTSCHNPHEELVDSTERRFLRKSNSGGAICMTCHALQSASAAVNKWTWNGAAGQQTNHATSVNGYDGTTNDGGITWLGSHTGYTTTQTNGCEACHRSHGPHNTARLLKGDTDTVCFQCHDGNAVTNILFPAPLQTTRQNILTAFTGKTYQHPGTGTTQAGHDPNETPLISTSRHSACDDCHNSHAAKGYTTPLVAPALSSTLFGVSGISSAGVVRDPRRNGGEAQFEYEICLKCHGDSTNKPQASTYATFGYTAYRSSFAALTDPYNVRLQFTSTLNTGVGSHHPVMTPRGSTRTQSSLLPFMLNRDGTQSTRSLGTGSQIYCGDCHNNDQDRQFVGSGTTGGPNGTHGSVNAHILERTYVLPTPPTTPGSSYSSVSGASTSFNGTYAMCAKCHNLTTVQSGDGFNHGQHFSYGCTVCHSAHGVQNSTTATTGLHQGLVDFDTRFCAPNQGTTTYTYPAYDGRHCYLVCHGTRHDANNP
jgi:predicted CXXCH cytochrome family protein